jgi:hypothetical protein
MTTSCVPALMDYLVTTSQGASTLGAASPPVTVFDGPVVQEQWPQLCLWVGVDAAYLLGNPTASGASADAQQNWVGPGNRKRDEHVTVHCVADAWFGNGDVATARRAAFGIVAALEDITRIDANAGGTVLFTEPGVTNLSLYQGNTNAGPRCLVGFDFSAFARIGS